MAAETFDFTGRATRRLLAEHAAEIPGPAIEQQLAQVQAKHPRARVYFDTEINDIVIDLSSGGA